MVRTDHVRESIIEAKVATSDAPYLASLVEEVEYAMYPPIHEQTKPTYGCILTDRNPGGTLNILEMPGVDASLIRQLADGVTNFAIRNRTPLSRIALNATATADEWDLLQLVRKTGGMLIHRSTTAVVRIINSTGIFICNNAQWTFRPLSSTSRRAVSQQSPQADETTLDSILKFAFHVLSPSHIGTTLVWWLAKPRTPPEDKYQLSSVGLSIVEPSHFNALRSLLSAHDGATFITKAGMIHSIGHHLPNSERSIEIIKQVRGKGTRHTSAHRFSFDEPRVLVFTVSADGPVSVFSDGIKVTDLYQENIEQVARFLEELVPEKANEVWPESTVVQCEKCGKNVHVDIIVIAGWRDPETGECPVCGETVYRKNCYRIDTRIIKRLPKTEDMT